MIGELVHENHEHMLQYFKNDPDVKILERLKSQTNGIGEDHAEDVVASMKDEHEGESLQIAYIYSHGRGKI